MNAKPADTERRYPLYVLMAIFGLMWVFADLAGQLAPNHLPTLMDNSLCYEYLGCNIGFFGYDAFVHFVLGLFLVAALLDSMHRYPRLNLLTASRARNFLIILGLVALVSFGWELIEYATDIYRTLALHQDLLHPINHLSQPTNADTMGDMCAALFGCVLSYTVIALADPGSARRSGN